MLRTLFTAFTFAALTALPVSAEDLASPTGDVLLTVTGSIEKANEGNAALLDLEMLEALEATTIETSTIWTEGPQTFQGVSLAVLVEELGITGDKLLATAINDYTVEIPMTDAVEGGAIVAYRMNGKTISVREKGPLWIVYPYDSDAKFRTEVIYSRSIWQLDRIQVMD